jgi:hypothetical protein
MLDAGWWMIESTKRRLSTLNFQRVGGVAGSGVRIIDVTAENVEENGFFCLMSPRNSDGVRWKGGFRN